MACLPVACLSLISVEKDLPGTSLPNVLHSLSRAFQSVLVRGNCRFFSVCDVSHKKYVFPLYCMGSCGRKSCSVPGKQSPSQPACPPVWSGKNGQQPVSTFHWDFSIKFIREGQTLTYSTVSNHLALFSVFFSMPMLQKWACPEVLYIGGRIWTGGLGQADCSGRSSFLCPRGDQPRQQGMSCNNVRDYILQTGQ